jgi:hypothetical protein
MITGIQVLGKKQKQIRASIISIETSKPALKLK